MAGLESECPNHHVIIVTLEFKDVVPSALGGATAQHEAVLLGKTSVSHTAKKCPPRFCAQRHTESPFHILGGAAGRVLLSESPSPWTKKKCKVQSKALLRQV